MKYWAACLLPLLVGASPAPGLRSLYNEVAPLLSSTSAKEIPNSYIVVFKKHVNQDDASDHHAWVQGLHQNSQNVNTELRKRSQFPFMDEVFEGLKHTYNVGGNLLGYSGHFDESVVDQIRRHPDVSRIEKGFSHDNFPPVKERFCICFK